MDNICLSCNFWKALERNKSIGICSSEDYKKEKNIEHRLLTHEQISCNHWVKRSENVSQI